MKKLKFQQGETVIVDGKEAVIEVAKKNFSSGKISYKLKDGREVAEDDIDRVGVKRKTGTNPKEINQDLHDLYKKTFDKDVPSNKKYDDVWIQSKIEEVALENALEEYKTAFGEEVPEDKKGDLNWIVGEIDAKNEADDGDDGDGDEPSNDEKYAALKELDFDGLKEIVGKKDLDIDLEDYDDADELLVAICDELEITIPNETE